MDLRTNLRAIATSYCSARGISLARLASLVVNDGKFFQRLEGGGGFTVRTYERFMTYFEEHPVEAPDTIAIAGLEGTLQVTLTAPAAKVSFGDPVAAE